MKTADLKTDGIVYMHRKGQYAYERPVLVLEARNWTERDSYVTVDGERKKIREIHRSEKGTRVGRGQGYVNYKLTGIPVLRLNVSEWDFREDADGDSRIIDSPLELLREAAELHDALALVDAETDVFSGGKSYRRVSVDARYADGQIRSVSVEFDLVRPQDLHKEWDVWVAEQAALRLQEAEWAMQRAEKQNKAVTEASEITRRVDALMGSAERYDHNGERYDIHRKNSTGSTYEVSHELLVKLLAMAEGSSTA